MCKEPLVLPRFYDPVIPEDKKVQILDMNFLYNPNCKDILKGMPKRNYELVCGIEEIRQETAKLLKLKGFRKIRFAWDYGLDQQYKIKDCYNKLIRAGYKPRALQCFILCDWKMSFEECLMKQLLLHSWGVEVSDCYFDGVVSPNFQCNHWSFEQCKLFRPLTSVSKQIEDKNYPPEIKCGVSAKGNGNNPLRDEWRTPRELWDILNPQYNFTLDCCATMKNTLIPSSFCDDFTEDFVAEDFVCWMNPPFITFCHTPIWDKLRRTSWQRCKISFCSNWNRRRYP